MKKVAAFFHNKDVLNRILFTLAIFLVFRIGSAIKVPGVQTTSSLWDNTTNTLSLLNMMGGGALQNFSIARRMRSDHSQSAAKTGCSAR